ncbi:hypothetical protein N865_14310 [Intrasporangium oryzae NRRL B-24470]|uniref:Uncharacterized protein n=1 Tax=Intrasporangium oryzae NRRL B-24470 TaxID=1386089 RepID=W9G5Q2_9MICO|nr:protealysin inhibitor emfourin [Intrasporangium oryzae]EWT00632.1 hypothetical protein N865_14310 [Intrasporangium oryzae NRRL B-24470]
MRITLNRSGGFAAVRALTGEITIDTDSLTEPSSREIEHLVGAVDFEHAVARQTPKPGAGDYISYTLTVSHDDGESAVSFTSPIADPTLQHLVSRIEEIGREKNPR